MTAKRLFTFDFSSPLMRPQLDLLTDETGIRISGVNNLHKDSPGHGSIGDAVDLLLTREEPDGRWLIKAFTHHQDYDEVAVETMRQKVRELMPRISNHWREIPTVDGRPVYRIE